MVDAGQRLAPDDLGLLVAGVGQDQLAGIGPNGVHARVSQGGVQDDAAHQLALGHDAVVDARRELAQ